MTCCDACRLASEPSPAARESRLYGYLSWQPQVFIASALTGHCMAAGCRLFIPTPAGSSRRKPQDIDAIKLPAIYGIKPAGYSWHQTRRRCTGRNATTALQPVRLRPHAGWRAARAACCLLHVVCCMVVCSMVVVGRIVSVVACCTLPLWQCMLSVACKGWRGLAALEGCM